MYFGNHGLRKTLLDQCLKSPVFEGSFKKRHGILAQTLSQCQGQLLYHIHWLLWRQLSYKKPLLVICQISRLFINTLSDDGKYSLFNRDTLTQANEMQVCRKQKTFSIFFSPFLKSNLNFEQLQKKMILTADVFPKLRTTKNLVRSMSKKSCFKGSFGKQHGKRAEALLKFECQHLYHIYSSLWMQLTFKNSLLGICKISILFPNTLSAQATILLLIETI